MIVITDSAMLRRLSDSPEDFVDHLKHVAAAIIMEVVYGYKLQSKGDHYIKIAHEALKGAIKAANAGTFLVDLLPIYQLHSFLELTIQANPYAVRYVLEWVPGAGFKKQARLWCEPTIEMNTSPFMTAKNAFATGTAKPSVVVSCLRKLSNPPSEEEVIRNACGVAYVAGVGTSVAAMISFILTMVLHPEAQQKAQAELDEVLGVDRLPTLEDRAHLLYVNALCEEVQRWRPALPLALPGRCIQWVLLTEEEPRGRECMIGTEHIRRGVIRAVLHEATYGARPDGFEPERFLRPDANLPTAQFGFGRRICPGRYLAANTFFIVIAQILKVFDISPAKDANGNEIPVSGLYTSGSLTEPEPFQCSIKPRSASAKTLILEQVVD
ncbi:cytochrome P450 [Ramaria rubella]|nr:cytochrome P450 [Ramaria rubella]